MSKSGKIVSRRFTEAREELGYTQKYLADISNVSRTTISQIEHNLIDTPSESIVFSIACALKKPYEYFYLPMDDSYSRTSEISFRSYKSQSSTDNKKAKVKLKRTSDMISYLYRYINGRSLDLAPIGYDDFESKSLSLADIEGIAFSVRQRWNMTQGPVIGLTTILENHGIICCAAELPEKTNSINYSVRFESYPNETSIILYNNKLTYFRQRFSLAHELGHIVLHHYWTKEDYEKYGDIAEKQADEFASAFLLPMESFGQSLIGKHVNTTTALALKGKWKVSISAIFRRMFDTGIISNTQYKYLNVEISKRGWRKIEPGDTTTPTEEPYYLQKGYEYLFRMNVISPEKILLDMALPASEIVSYIGNSERFISRTMQRHEFSLRT